jgi:hypothetical protein
MRSRLAGSIPGVATLVLAAALTADVPTSSVRAEDCLASPNSPAPGGSWWYYRLDGPTHRKCWYLRPVGTPVQQTAEQATKGSGQPTLSTSAPTRPSDSTDDRTASLPAADTALVGSTVQDAAALQASQRWSPNLPASPEQNDASVVSATTQSADEGTAADRPIPEPNTSPQTNDQAAPVGEVSLDAVPRIMAHASTNDATAPGPDDYIDRVVSSRKQAANEQPPLSVFVIAISGLAVIGIIGIHFVRRLRFSQSNSNRQT